MHTEREVEFHTEVDEIRANDRDAPVSLIVNLIRTITTREIYMSVGANPVTTIENARVQRTVVQSWKLTVDP